MEVIAERLAKFNSFAGNLGILRDITPQHFQALMGDYAKRDRRYMCV
jgi:hypothetical protein